MGYAETILQAVRAWHTSVTGLASGAVIPEDDKGTRPTLPYLTVRVGPIVVIGTDEYREHANGRRMYGVRRVTIAVSAFGKQSHALEEYLDGAALALASRSIRDALDAAGVSIERVGPIVSVPVLRDTTIERHYVREYAITFAIRPSAYTETALDYVEIATTLHDTADVDDDKTPLTFTVQTPISGD